MKKLFLGLLLVSTLTFSQTTIVSSNEKTTTFNVTDLVRVEIKGTNILTDIKEYRGTIIVNYWNVAKKQDIFTMGEYTNMLGFTEKGTLPAGTYIIEVIKEGKRTTQTFQLKG